MKSADRNNIFIHEQPNPHKNGGGVMFYPVSQLKVMVEAAAKPGTPKPDGKWANIVSLQCDGNFTQNKKPRHVFVKTDLKLINKQKREDLEAWKKEETDLRKRGIQRKRGAPKEAPKQIVKEDPPADQWPDIEEKEDDQKGEQNFDDYNEEETNDETKEEQQHQEQKQENEEGVNVDEDNQNEEEPDEKKEAQQQNGSDNEENSKKGNNNDQINEGQVEEELDQQDQATVSKSGSELPEKLDESKLIEGENMHISKVSKSHQSGQSQLSNKSNVIYKSQVADVLQFHNLYKKMREMMVNFE